MEQGQISWFVSKLQVPYVLPIESGKKNGKCILGSCLGMVDYKAAFWTSVHEMSSRCASIQILPIPVSLVLATTHTLEKRKAAMFGEHQMRSRTRGTTLRMSDGSYCIIRFGVSPPPQAMPAWGIMQLVRSSRSGSIERSVKPR